MYLCIESTERNNHHLILVDKNFQKECYSTEPFLLQAIEHFLSTEKILKNSIQGIAVVVGSGSFSSVRIAVTLANTWHYALEIPVFGIEKKQIEEIENLYEKIFLEKKDTGFILPSYSGEPNIG